MNRLIVIYGATGVGKTELSIALSQRFDAPIVSSDSRQVFREMSIGTAVPTPTELAAAPHFFIHDRSVENGFSAGEFEKEALKLLAQLFEKHQNVLLVGGSNLYINALLRGFDDLPTDPAVREKLNQMRLTELQTMLHERDLIYYKTVDLNNIARVRRAVEVCLITGRTYTELRRGKSKARDFEVLKIGLQRPRKELYDRINARVDQMIAQGLESEAQMLYPYRHLAALQTVGYREMFDYFEGNVTLERAIELIKQNTRHYAKRQITWLRSEDNVELFNPDELSRIIEYIESK